MSKHVTIDSPKLLAHVTAIRQLGKQTIANVISIGEHLTECKRIVGHGNFGDFLKREFEWHENTALNYMRMFELSKKSTTVVDLDLPLKSLYLLAAPSTPKIVRDEIIERAEKGEKVKHKDVKAAVSKSKAPKEKPAPRTNGATETGEQRKERAAQEVGQVAAKVACIIAKAPTETDAALAAREAQAKALQNVGGPGSAAEAERLHIQVEELQNENHRLELENRGLKSEIEELKAPRIPRLAENGEPLLSCSFCGKDQTAVPTLIRGDNGFICNECVALCEDIVLKRPQTDAPPEVDPERIQRLITEWNEVLGDIYEKFDPDRQMWATLVLASELNRARKTFDTLTTPSTTGRSNLISLAPNTTSPTTGTA